jgi:hypothetical protein
MDSSISTTEKSYLLQKRRRESDDNSHLMFPIKKDINQIPNTQTQTTPKTKNRFVLNHSFVNNKICTNNQVNTSVNNSINSNNALQNSLNNSLYGSNYTNKNLLFPKSDAKVLVDNDYIMASLGVLSKKYEEASLKLMLKSLRLEEE